MTRDGTFLIQNGKITHALNNLRFSEHLTDAFRNVSAIGKELSAQETDQGLALVPAIKLPKFYIAGSSSY